MSKFKYRQQELLTKQGAPKKLTKKQKKKEEKMKKKKSKPAVARKPPAWLFPSSEANPPSLSRSRTEEELELEEAERWKCFEYMQREARAGPAWPEPPSQLLTLVGMFLSDFGFACTSRLLDSECEARQDIKGWQARVGETVEGVPTLENIYLQWCWECKAKQKDSMSNGVSGNKDHSVDQKKVKPSTKSSVGEDGKPDSDIEMKDAPKPKKSKAAKKAKSPSPSSSSSSSDSDADDEDEAKSKVAAASRKAELKPEPAAEKATDKAKTNKLKRKAGDSRAEPEPEQPAPTKKAKPVATKNKEVKGALTNGTSKKTGFAACMDETDSSSSSSSDDEKPKLNGASVKPVSQPTTNGTSTAKSTAEPDSATSVSSGSDSDSPSDEAPALTKSKKTKKNAERSKDDQPSPPPTATTTEPKLKNPKKKHTGAQPTPLALASSQTPSSSQVSNEYKPYNYADKAYHDLSVTKGKGFTKEKNKKKRGSYRGGTIDVAGVGRGFKFDD